MTTERSPDSDPGMPIPPGGGHAMDKFGLPIRGRTRRSFYEWMPLGSVISGLVATGLGITDVVEFRILAGWLVVAGCLCGAFGVSLAGIAGMRQPNSAGWTIRIGRLLGIAGFFMLLIGSGNGSALNNAI